MRVHRSADYRRMPWKNGGGETIEIAVSPPGAAFDDFHWRISMAHVAKPGPFSLFPEIDRTLAVIEGDGIALEIEGRGTVRLGPDAPPFSFPGDVHVGAKLLGGAIDDLNVMTRRGRYRHWLSRLNVSASIVLPRLGDLMMVMTRHGGARLRAGRAQEQLETGDTALLDESDGARLEVIPQTKAELYVADLWRV
jgi:environmental stress-induced protein Ves